MTDDLWFQEAERDRLRVAVDAVSGGAHAACLHSLAKRLSECDCGAVDDAWAGDIELLATRLDALRAARDGKAGGEG